MFRPKLFVRNLPRVAPKRPVLRPNLAETGQKSIMPIPAVMRNLLAQPTLVIERQIEFLNLFAGFEQVSRYHIYDAAGNTLGYMEEVDNTFTRAMMRQIYRLHRPFTVNVYDASGQHAMTVRRPFSFINSQIKAVLPGHNANDESAVVGESRQEWHLWRRRYNLYVNDAEKHQMDQFARVDAPFLSFTFQALDEDDKLVGSVDRNWVGLAREMFTDTGVYVLRMGTEPLSQLDLPVRQYNLSLEERAVMLAMAVSIDFDYFSRHSNQTGGTFFLPGGSDYDN